MVATMCVKHRVVCFLPSRHRTLSSMGIVLRLVRVEWFLFLANVP